MPEQTQRLVESLQFYADTYARLPTLGVDELAEAASNIIAGVLSYRVALVAIADADSSEVILRGHKGIAVTDARDTNSLQKLIDWLRSNTTGPKSYIIDEFAPDLGQIAERWDLGEALLVVPVRLMWDYQERQVGLLMTARPRKGRAGNAQVALMTLDILAGFVAGSIASLFARERLKKAEQAIRKGERRTHLLKEVALAANAAMSPEDAFQVTVDQVCTFTGWPVGHVYLPAGDGSPDLAPTGIWHLDDPDAFTTFKGVTATARFAPGVGLPGRVLSSGAPAWIQDVTVDANFPRAQQAKDIGVRGTFGFPVIVDDQVAAVLEFFSRDTEPPDEPLLEVMGQIGVQLGNVIDRKQKAKALAGERALLAERVAERTVELRVANAQLEHASRAKDEFLASMSHELRTPLNAVLSLSESLLEGIYGEVNERQVKTVGMIESSGRHLLSLINDILDLSKVEAGKMELSIGTVNVAEVCEASLLFVRERATKKRLKLSLSIDPLVVTVTADERRLKQILVNLLTNSVKFTDEGKVELEVTSDRDRRMVDFTVRDTGIGIAPENLKKLFTPFSQVDSGLDRQYEGTGLGLSLVKQMIELHSGSVDVVSEGVGRGTRFTIGLPWSPEDQRREVRVAHPVTTGLTPEVAGRVRRTLVVEDSRTVSDQLRRYLEELDSEVLVLPHGTGAATQAEAFRPDAILLDIYLPDESGWEVLEELKANPLTSDIPVVIISDADERERGLQAGAAEYVVKPVSRMQLRAAMMLVLGSHIEETHAKAGRPSVLLAEDNEMNIVSITDYLEAKGFQVRVARDGVDALEALATERPDLVLMDIQMPRMDGLEAIRKIRADDALRDLPIIALTALAMSGDEQRIREAGADEYVSKPVHMKQLVATIEKLLNR